ncbi:NAD(P)-binding domain-containing protein [Pseudonocardia asaccharolytica]|uniref:KARI N-terminal Rossmann domain-containing protein n=1 Tax=Pseudonocardia asaccharolytica DSM 44247 = NBRC 16224 TaxID=1123024 RepID=A0A511D575_9PSEU|nr:hypothetical protein PA7_37830 [Pseudonocardia asaccharolytica DSM 44247 = NBRC 16224]
MRARTYYDSDTDLGVLAGRTVAVIGYGNQGCAQAQNLRDSGIRLIVGNRHDDYRERAVRDGFEVLDIDEAARAGQVVLLLIPDEVQPGVVAEQIAPGLGAGDTLVVASGYNLAFGLLELPDGIDVVMVAPRMIGEAVRDRYRHRIGYPCLVSVERDVTGTALATALAVARGIGATAAGAVVLGCLGVDQLTQPVGHRADEYRSPVLRAPHHVQAEVVGTPGGNLHVTLYTIILHAPYVYQ